MAKAILVIDINDDIKKYSVDVFKQNEDGDVMLEVATDLSLRLLPNRKRYRDHTPYFEGYTDGWNACVQFIEE